MNPEEILRNLGLLPPSPTGEVVAGGVPSPVVAPPAQAPAPGGLPAPVLPAAPGPTLPVQVTAPDNPAPPKPLSAKQSAELLKATSPADFTAQGGVVGPGLERSMQDLGKLWGGAARSEAAFKAGVIKSARTIADLNAEKTRKEADQIVRDADSYATLAKEFDAEAMADIKDLNTRVKTAAESKTDPARYWNNASGFSRAMWILTFAAAGFQRGGKHLPTVMQALQQVIGNDIQAQEFDKGKLLEGLEKERANLIDKRDIRQNTLKDTILEQANRLTGLSKALQAEIDKIGNEAAEANGLLQVKAELDASAVQLQEKFQVQRKEKAFADTQRAFEAKQQEDRQLHDKEMAELNAEIDLMKDAAKQQAKGGPPTLNRDLGARLIGADGKEIPFRIPGEGDAVYGRAVDANNVLNAANKRYTALRTIQDNMPGDLTELVRGGNAEFRSAVIQAAYEQARINDPAARITDIDYAQAVKQVLGVDVSGFTGGVYDVTKLPGDALDQVAERVDSQIRAIPKTVADQVGAFANPNDIASGATVVFEPKDLRTGKPKPDTVDDAKLRLGGAGLEPGDIPDRKRKPIGEAPGLTGNYVVSRVGESPGQAAQNQADATRRAGESALARAQDANEVASAITTYEADKKSNRLPVLPQDEEEVVDYARRTFKNLSAAAIADLVNAAWKNPELSSEAKVQISGEAAMASRGKTSDKEYGRLAEAIVRATKPIIDFKTGQQPKVTAEEKAEMIKALQIYNNESPE